MKVESYADALRHAWRITLHRKRMWLLGFLAALIGSGGAFEYVVKFYYTLTGSRTDLFVQRVQFVLQTFSENGIWFGLLVLFVMLAVIALVVVLLVSAQGGLIAAVQQVEEGNPVVLGRMLRAGARRLGPLFVINFVKVLAFIVLLFITNALAVRLAAGPALWQALVFVPISAVVLVVGLTVVVLAMYAACYAVLHRRSLKMALADAWALFMDHALVSLEMSIVIFLVGLLLTLLLLVCLTILGAPVLIAYLMAVVSGNTALLAVSIIIAIALFVILVSFFSAFYTVYAVSAWTVLFLQMDRKGFSSRMLHWLRKIKK